MAVDDAIELKKSTKQPGHQLAETRPGKVTDDSTEVSMSLLLESAGEAVYAIDVAGICIYVNPACITMLGYTDEQDILGRNMHELIHHSKEDGSPYAVEECRIYKAHISGGHISHDDEVFWRRDGSCFPVEYAVRAIRRNEKMAGSVVTFHDITGRKEIEAELARSRDTLQRAQSIAHIGSWDWDIVGGGLYWTDEIYRIFGLTPQEFGATYEAFLEYIHPDDRAAVVEAVNKTVVDAAVIYEIEHRVVRPDGTIRIVNERGNVYRDARQQPIRMIGTVQDITEKKHAEAQIKKLNEELELRVEQRTAELQAANENLQESLCQLSETQAQLVQSEKMASLGGLVAGVAHEINTPVGVGVTAITHMQMKLDDYAARYQNGQLTRDDFETMIATTAETGRIVQMNLERAASLIRSFKQVAVDQAGNEMRDFNLKGYLDEILQSLQPHFKRGGHSAELDCPEDILLYNHPGALAQVITNLVVNSTLHGFSDTCNGRITITVTTAGKDRIKIVYVDNGRGMDADTSRKVFEPFFTTRRNQGGAGLGMHITYNLVTQTMDGKISCNSQLGKGAEFMIELPLVHRSKAGEANQQKLAS
ncbi:MAG: PAS domain S-box protein [Gammaproteobacteria bacterium]|nr:PAS domain S-box protein [Gammaproteobacteria bacterium]MDH5653731.1 PAS domain S-box protein [Gammaproteobacteria bacterium]